MSSRFSIIQGGLPRSAPRIGSRAHLTLVAATCVDRQSEPKGWRVVLHRSSELAESDVDAWRALAARAIVPDPFADPDFLMPSARHEIGSRAGGPVFAFAYFGEEDGTERLRGVIPLALPHPIWGGSAVNLWQAPLAPHPIEPAFGKGAARDALAAVLDHLARIDPRVTLRLAGLAEAGDLLAELRSDCRLCIEEHRAPTRIPQSQFVSVSAPATITDVERITAPDQIRDAVERFLLLDAQRSRCPLMADPAAVSVVRVVTRLLARRELVEVELNSAFGRTISAAIRLGRQNERVVWRLVDLDALSPPHRPTIDIVVGCALSEPHVGTARLG